MVFFRPDTASIIEGQNNSLTFFVILRAKFMFLEFRFCLCMCFICGVLEHSLKSFKTLWFVGLKVHPGILSVSSFWSRVALKWTVITDSILYYLKDRNSVLIMKKGVEYRFFYILHKNFGRH